MPSIPMLNQEFFIKAGMAEVSPKEFALRSVSIAGVMLALASAFFKMGLVTDPIRLMVIVLLPALIVLVEPYLSYLNMASKTEKDLWAYLAGLWMLQRVGKSLGSSFGAVREIAVDKEAREYFDMVSGRLLATGTLEGLETNIALCPSETWKRIFSRLHDYYFTRGEAIDEMLKVELDESVEKAMIHARKTMEQLMMVMIVYTLVSTAFPFVIMMMFTFQTLLSGLGGGGISNLVLLTTGLPSPFFILLFKIFAPRYFYFPRRTAAKAWIGFFAVFLVSFIGIAFIPPSLYVRVSIRLRPPNVWERAALSVALGSLVGVVQITKIERRLKGETFDFPLFLQDLFSELRGRRAFSEAIITMKVTYRSMKDMASKLKCWASMKLPYTDILRRAAERQRLSVSRMATLLIMTAIEAGAELKEAFSAVSGFSSRMRELWIETEGEKMSNYLTAVVSAAIMMGSYALLVRVLNIPAIAPIEAVKIKTGIMMQAFIQSLVIASTLGIVRTGHATSSFRELLFFSLAAFGVMVML